MPSKKNPVIPKKKPIDLLLDFCNDPNAIAMLDQELARLCVEEVSLIKLRRRMVLNDD